MWSLTPAAAAPPDPSDSPPQNGSAALSLRPAAPCHTRSASPARRRPSRARAGISGPPPSEVVEGLRNPYLDKFIPPRRREASEAYRAYKPIIPKYLTCGLDADFSQNSVDAVAAFVETLDATLKSGALHAPSSSVPSYSGAPSARSRHPRRRGGRVPVAPVN